MHHYQETNRLSAELPNQAHQNLNRKARSPNPPVPFHQAMVPKRGGRLQTRPTAPATGRPIRAQQSPNPATPTPGRAQQILREANQRLNEEAENLYQETQGQKADARGSGRSSTAAP